MRCWPPTLTLWPWCSAPTGHSRPVACSARGRRSGCGRGTAGRTREDRSRGRRRWGRHPHRTGTRDRPATRRGDGLLCDRRGPRRPAAACRWEVAGAGGRVGGGQVDAGERARRGATSPRCLRFGPPTTGVVIRPRHGSCMRSPTEVCSSTRPECARSASGPTSRASTPSFPRSSSMPRPATIGTAPTSPSLAAPCERRWRTGIVRTVHRVGVTPERSGGRGAASLRTRPADRIAPLRPGRQELQAFQERWLIGRGRRRPAVTDAPRDARPCAPARGDRRPPSP